MVKRAYVQMIQVKMSLSVVAREVGGEREVKGKGKARQRKSESKRVSLANASQSFFPYAIFVLLCAKHGSSIVQSCSLFLCQPDRGSHTPFIRGPAFATLFEPCQLEGGGGREEKEEEEEEKKKLAPNSSPGSSLLPAMI